LTEIELEEFLAPRRKEDEGDSLWVVLNRVQESVLKGGYSITNVKNKLRRAKSIKNIQQDIKLNQQVWELAETFA
jgi:predicted ABC-type ATPase